MELRQLSCYVIAAFMTLWFAVSTGGMFVSYHLRKIYKVLKSGKNVTRCGCTVLEYFPLQSI